MLSLVWSIQAREGTALAGWLKPEESVTLMALNAKGPPNVQVAQALGVSEGPGRYHGRRADKPDGRKGQPPAADDFAAAIDDWPQPRSSAAAAKEPDACDLGFPRPANIHALHDWLRSEHDYTGSYKSVLRFARGRYGMPRLRP